MELDNVYYFKNGIILNSPVTSFLLHSNIFIPKHFNTYLELQKFVLESEKEIRVKEVYLLTCSEEIQVPIFSKQNLLRSFDCIISNFSHEESCIEHIVYIMWLKEVLIYKYCNLFHNHGISIRKLLYGLKKTCDIPYEEFYEYVKFKVTKCWCVGAVSLSEIIPRLLPIFFILPISKNMSRILGDFLFVYNFTVLSNLSRINTCTDYKNNSLFFDLYNVLTPCKMSLSRIIEWRKYDNTEVFTKTFDSLYIEGTLRGEVTLGYDMRYVRPFERITSEESLFYLYLHNISLLLGVIVYPSQDGLAIYLKNKGYSNKDFILKSDRKVLGTSDYLRSKTS